MRAWLNLRGSVPEREAAFRAGLRRLGYSIEPGLCYAPRPGDLQVTWNRIGQSHEVGKRFEAMGLPVLVAENAAWGNDFNAGRWYSLARNYHNSAGCFPVGAPERWDSQGVELADWRTSGETVVLPQRGIGPPGVAMPRGWGEGLGFRVRRHPGPSACLPLADDLRGAGKVITWSSGAAIKALMWGIPVESHMPNWIGQQDNTDEGRLAMFRRLAWAQFDLCEFASGFAFERMLS